jgi:hypothetical protein
MPYHQIGYLKTVSNDDTKIYTNFILVDTNNCISITSNIKEHFSLSYFLKNNFLLNCSFTYLDNLNDFIIYPIPAKNFITIKNISKNNNILINNKQFINLEIFNVLGDRIYLSDLKLSDIINEHLIDITSFSTGTYFLKITCRPFKNIVIKFIKL